MYITDSMLTQVGTQHYHLLVGFETDTEPYFNVKFDSLDDAIDNFYKFSDELFPDYLNDLDKQVIREQIAEAAIHSESGNNSIGGTITRHGFIIEVLDCHGCLYVNNN